MTRLAGLAVLLVVLLASALPVNTSQATAIEVRTSTAQNRFPDGLLFNLFTISNAEVTTVRLRFRILPDGITSFVRPTCNAGTSVNCSVTVGNVGNVYITPGAQVVYAWDIEDASGAKLTSNEQTVTYEDTRFQWQSVTDRDLTVYFYAGSQQSNQGVLATARETMDRVGALLKTRVDHPIKIWVYATAREMQPAIASRRGQGPDTSVNTLGEVSSSDTALVSRDTDFLNIVRHELAHIVTGRATRDHAAGIPVWVNEGLSTFAQRELLPDEARALDLAIRRNAVLGINQLSVSARGAADVVSLFYAQSGSLVAYLINTHGGDKFGDFVAGMKSDTLDGSMTKTYGFDQYGLENEWRRSLGLPALAAAQPGSSNERPLPTIQPFGSNPSQPQATPAPNDQSSSQTSDDDSDGGSILPIAVGVFALAALAAGGGVLYIRRKRSQTSV